ncbi:amino acid permease [Bacillus horti]|uniref:Amino acid permease n=1 Tax=Caldalkalibacillus horti TaxID=77523 RepID=A0ABT9VZB0_9BACI|nr:amino acid permease [Bacillus horti]
MKNMYYSIVSTILGVFFIIALLYFLRTDSEVIILFKFITTYILPWIFLIFFIKFYKVYKEKNKDSNDN